MKAILDAIMWWSIGVFLAWVMLRSQVATVSRMRVTARWSFVWSLGVGLLFRLLFAALVLLGTARAGLAPLLWVLGGFWSARMVLIVQLHRGRIFRRYLWQEPDTG